MLAKSLAIILLAVSSVSAHAAIAPPLGVTGTPARSDVQRPSAAKPCGTIDIASTLDTSTPIAASADGSFTATITDFNAGADGSRSIKTANVDATGVGKTFIAGTVTKNGNANPTTVGSDQLTIQMPAGTTCTGGKAGNRCLVSLTTTAGFGNCVVVSQGGAGAGGAAAAGSNATAAAAGATGANSTTTATQQKHHGHKAGTAGAVAGAGAQNAVAKHPHRAGGSAAARAGQLARAARAAVEGLDKRILSNFFEDA